MNVRRSRRVLAAVGVSVAVVTAGASFAAQTAPRTLPAAPLQQNQTAPAQAQQPDRPNGRFANRVERRLDFLHYELRITTAQQHLWDNFADAVRGEEQQVRDRLAGQNRGPADHQADNGRRGQPSVVERLEQRQQRLANQTARADRLLGALRPLYAALDANQKRTADRQLFQPETDRGGRMARRFAMNGRFERPFQRDYR